MEYKYLDAIVLVCSPDGGATAGNERRSRETLHMQPHRLASRDITPRRFLIEFVANAAHPARRHHLHRFGATSPNAWQTIYVLRCMHHRATIGDSDDKSTIGENDSETSMIFNVVDMKWNGTTPQGANMVNTLGHTMARNMDEQSTTTHIAATKKAFESVGKCLTRAHALPWRICGAPHSD